MLPVVLIFMMTLLSAQTILIDDGKLGLTVTAKDIATREFEVVVENDGTIAKQKVLTFLTQRFLSCTC